MRDLLLLTTLCTKSALVEDSAGHNARHEARYGASVDGLHLIGCRR